MGPHIVISTTTRLFGNTALCCVLLFFQAFACTGQTLKAKADSIVRKYDSAGGYNGIIIMGFGSDSLLILEYGYKDPAAKTDRISVKDRFDLASVTKQFTGLAVLQLIEKGLIGKDDPIGKYIPELRPALQKVTVTQLANHTNGIHDFYALTSRHDTLNNGEALAMLYNLDTTVFAPGSRWGYSNSGYLLLSELVQRVTGTGFEDYCRNNLFVPLGMTSACYLPGPCEVLYGYTEKLNPVIYNAFSSGEAGMYASGEDIIAYYRTVCRHPEQWRRYFTRSYEWSEASNTPGWNYGFGWYFSEDSLGKFRAHSGRNWGADTYIRWYENDNTFLCLLSNKKSDIFFKALREELAGLLIEEKQ